MGTAKNNLYTARVNRMCDGWRGWCEWVAKSYHIMYDVQFDSCILSHMHSIAYTTALIAAC